MQSSSCFVLVLPLPCQSSCLLQPGLGIPVKVFIVLCFKKTMIATLTCPCLSEQEALLQMQSP